MRTLTTMIAAFLAIISAAAESEISFESDSGASVTLSYAISEAPAGNACITIVAGGSLTSLDMVLAFTGSGTSLAQHCYVMILRPDGGCLQVGGIGVISGLCPNNVFSWPATWNSAVSGQYEAEVEVVSANLATASGNWFICIGNGGQLTGVDGYEGTLELVGITTGSATTPSPTAAATSEVTATPVPTAVPTASDPTSSPPTSTPSASVAEHIYVRAVDIHGDGWGEDISLAVHSRHLSAPLYYSLTCACDTIRLPADDMILSIHRNTSVHHAPFEWEVLWTAGYSDGLTETPFGVYGDVSTEMRISNWGLISVSRSLDINANAPKNKCKLPPPKPTATKSANNSVDEAPSPLVNVRLALGESNGNGWCDDSGDAHEFTCYGDAGSSTLPNLLTYPRYFISDAEGFELLLQGTMRVNDAVEEVRELKLPREGSFVFSVSGHYLSESGSLSWDFCGKQGGIGERLYFNMEHGVCKPHYVEVADGEISCGGTTSADTHLSVPVVPLAASDELTQFHAWLHASALVAAILVVVALVLVFVKGKTNRLTSTGTFSV